MPPVDAKGKTELSVRVVFFFLNLNSLDIFLIEHT
jgi:hypothetical protein